MTRRRSRVLRLALVALLVAAVAWVVARLGWRRLVGLALDADPGWLALSLVPVLLRFPLWGLKWWLMLRDGPAVPYRFALRSVLAGAFVNLTTPTAKLGGGVLRAALLRRRTGCGLATAYGWALADQLGNVLGNLALVALLASAAGLAHAGAGRAFLAPGLAAGALVVAALGLRGPLGRLLARPAVARRLAGWAPRPAGSAAAEPEGGWLDRVLDPFLRRRGRAGAVATDVGLAAATFGTLCLANALVLRALGVDVPLALVSACVALGYMAGTLTGTMGGIGATELALIELYAAAGVPREAATAGALLHRAGFYLVTAVWGGLALWQVAGGRR